MEFGKFELATLGSEKEGCKKKRGRNRPTDAGQQGATDSVRASFLFLFRPITVHILAQVGVSSFSSVGILRLYQTHTLLQLNNCLNQRDLRFGVRKADHNPSPEKSKHYRLTVAPPRSPRIAFCVSIK